MRDRERSRRRVLIRVRLSSWKEFLFLLRREFLFQLDGRRSFPRGVYPGVNWFVLLCAGALLLEFNSSRFAPESSSSVVDHFMFLSLAQIFLVALRSTVYCAISMSRDLQNHAAAVVRVSPVSRTLTLAAKLCACLAPLWTELLLYLPVAILFFSVYLWLSPVAIASVVGFLFCSSLVCGCLGLAVGSTTSAPLQAARNARLLIFFLLFFFPILTAVSDGWVVPLAALALWLSATTRRTPHRAVLLVGAGVLVAGLPILISLMPPRGGVSLLHPLTFTGRYLQDFFDGNPELSLRFLEQPLGMGGLYLLISVVLFFLARARYQYVR